MPIDTPESIRFDTVDTTFRLDCVTNSYRNSLDVRQSIQPDQTVIDFWYSFIELIRVFIHQFSHEFPSILKVSFYPSSPNVYILSKILPAHFRVESPEFRKFLQPVVSRILATAVTRLSGDDILVCNFKISLVKPAQVIPTVGIESPTTLLPVVQGLKRSADTRLSALSPSKVFRAIR